MSDRLWQPPYRAYGQIADLPHRLADWVGRMKIDRSLPWVGLGLIADLELTLKLLTLEEFGQFLRTHPDPELQPWGDEILTAVDDRDELVALTEDIDDAVGAGDSADTYNDDVKRLGEKADALADVRAVLVEAGALSADDTETALPDLIRALLS